MRSDMRLLFLLVLCMVLGLGALLIVDALTAGCAVGPVPVRIVGRLLDSGGRPIVGAEVYALDADDTADDENLGRMRAEARENAEWYAKVGTHNALRDSRITLSDSAGQYTLAVIWVHGRSTGLISSLFRPFSGDDPPPLPRWTVGIDADGFYRRVVPLDGGKLGLIPNATVDSWVYEMPTIRLRD